MSMFHCFVFSFRHLKGGRRTYGFFAGDASPHVSARVVSHGLANTAGLGLILAADLLNLRLDIDETDEWGERNVVILAVFLQRQALAREEHIGLTGRGKIRYSVADEDNERHLVRITLRKSLRATLVHGQGLVDARVDVVAPDGQPFRAVGRDDGVVGDDLDC